MFGLEGWMWFIIACGVGTAILTGWLIYMFLKDFKM